MSPHSTNSLSFAPPAPHVVRVTDDVWHVILSFLTVKELLCVVARVSRRFFSLILGDAAASGNFWREMWLIHLCARGGGGGSQEGRGLGTLLQGIRPLACAADGGIGRYNRDGDEPASTLEQLCDSMEDVNFILDHSLGVTSASPLVFSVAPVHITLAPLSDTMLGHTAAFGAGGSHAHATLRRLAKAILDLPSTKMDPLSFVAMNGRPSEETPRRSLLYAQALCFFASPNHSRCLLEGRLMDVIHLKTFSADNIQTPSTATALIQKGIELRKALQASWACMYSAQLMSAGAGATTQPQHGLERQGPAAEGHAQQTGRAVAQNTEALRTGNRLFDINVLLTCRRKRTDVYAGIINGVLTDIPDGLGIVFPVCASMDALAAWRDILVQEQEAHEAAGRPGAVANASDSVPTTSSSPPLPPPRWRRREVAEEEERMFVSNNAWPTSRRYVLSPYYAEDSESDSDEERRAGTVGDGTQTSTSARSAEPRPEAVRPPRLSAAQKAQQREAMLTRRANRFLEEEDAMLTQGVALASICVGAKPGTVCVDYHPARPIPEDSHAATSDGPREQSHTGTRTMSHHPSSSDSPSLLARVRDGESSHVTSSIASSAGSISIHSDDFSDASAGSAHANEPAVNPLRHLPHPSEAASPRGRGDVAGHASESDTASPSPHLSPPAPLLFPLEHVATYLYLLQHVTFTDVRQLVWEPDERRFAVCARIVSPTGDAVETQFFSSHMMGYYPRFYMKMSFSPAALPDTLMRTKLDQSSCDPSDTSGSDDTSEDEHAHTRDGDEDIVFTAEGEEAHTPPNPSAFPSFYAKQQGKTRGRRCSERDRRRVAYRHQRTVDFNAVVDIFCGGYGRVEVDIPPTVSRKGFEVLRSVLGLGEDFPMSLLWNAVVYAAGFGRDVWRDHLSSFLYHYKMTFTDAMERAFGRRECYGPLNGLRPREFPDAAHVSGRASEAARGAEAPVLAGAAPAPMSRAAGELPPPADPVTVQAREEIPATTSTTTSSPPASSSSADTSSLSSPASSDLTSSHSHRFWSRSDSDNDTAVSEVANHQGIPSHGQTLARAAAQPRRVSDASSSNDSSSVYLDEHEDGTGGDCSDDSADSDTHGLEFPPHSSEVQAATMTSRHVPRVNPLAALDVSRRQAEGVSQPAPQSAPQRTVTFQRPRDSDSDSSSEPAPSRENLAAPEAEDEEYEEEDLYSDASINEAWREAYY